MIKLMTPLTPAQELLIEQTIKHCTEVHKALGPGLLENIYSRAIALELTAAAIPFEREKSYPRDLSRGAALSATAGFCRRGHLRTRDQIDRSDRSGSPCTAAQLLAHF